MKISRRNFLAVAGAAVAAAALTACGGSVYTSAVEAALKNDGKVVGVDVDQNDIGVKPTVSSFTTVSYIQ